jgi:hypothetical protein
MSLIVMDFVATHPYLVLGAIATALLLWNYASRKKSGLLHLPLPPGPKGLPIIGSLFDMPAKWMWLEYDKWFKIYGMLSIVIEVYLNGLYLILRPGDMFYFKVLGQGYLILGSTVRINELLEKRSSNYSDRAPMPMLLDL